MKQIIQKCFNRLGYKIVKNKKVVDASNYSWADFGAGWNTKRLKDLNLEVNSIIDIGVAAGTPTLYETFPDCPLLLIEPLSLFNEKIENHLGERFKNATILNCAVGNRETEASITYNVDFPLQGSLFSRDISNKQGASITENVTVRKLDNILDEINVPTPYLIKIDVEGNELAAIQGAKKALKNASALIVEITLDDSYPSGTETLRDINKILTEAGFLLVDLADALALGSSGKRHVKKADFIYVNQSMPDGLQSEL